MPLSPSKIRARREKLKLTQAEAAERAEMPRPHWVRIEAGHRSNPSLDTAERVAKALRVPLAKLLTPASP
jgi:transcriptional regulator with XRE-family HTH domain